MASVPNHKLVTPAERAKLAPLLRHYAKSAHPFTQCVRDNRKRFGPRTEQVCAVVKDLVRGTTMWRGKGKELSASDLQRVVELADASGADCDELRRLRALADRASAVELAFKADQVRDRFGRWTRVRQLLNAMDKSLKVPQGGGASGPALPQAKEARTEFAKAMTELELLAPDAAAQVNKGKHPAKVKDDLNVEAKAMEEIKRSLATSPMMKKILARQAKQAKPKPKAKPRR